MAANSYVFRVFCTRNHNAGLPQSGKKSGKKIFQDHGKVMKFCYKSVKMSFFEKVRESQSWSGNFFFIFFLFFSFILKTFVLKLVDQDEIIE